MNDTKDEKIVFARIVAKQIAPDKTRVVVEFGDNVSYAIRRKVLKGIPKELDGKSLRILIDRLAVYANGK